ncbi:MAG: hypothetical protein BGN86_07415 [Caulobacterales bacterium 68-7]|nr:DUF3307 domain-containing protein [Caulobacterales bacterium]OJU13009.1 MAG: hypothetical protein BGN86_07415 [Caulobacterales bacterium 68-7]
MLEVFLALLTAHLLADFPLQPEWVVRKKEKPWVLGGHVAVVATVTILVTGSADPRVWAMVAGTHAAMDFIKVHFMKKGGLPAFALDQAVHVAVIAAVAIWRPNAVADGWYAWWPTEVKLLAYRAMAMASGVIAAVMAGGIITKMLLTGVMPTTPAAPAATPQTTPATPATAAAPATTTPTAGSDPQDLAGLPRGGAHIGMLERGLILTFILIGQPEGIGFMLAAKSVLRFSDRSARTHTEYVIIGTLTSFGWSILVALATHVALQHWR